jgi:hypothetical protein
MKIKTADALSLFDNSPTALGRAFAPPISRWAVHQWGEYMPELRARQLVERRPEAAAYIEGPDGVTPAERAAAATHKAAGTHTERSASEKEDSRG